MIFDLFDMISALSLASTPRQFIIKCSFVQIYNEQILDLLNPLHLQAPSTTNARGASSSSSSQRNGAARKHTKPGATSPGGLKLRWSAAREFYVENLRVLECQSPQQVIQHFQEGIQHKVMASHRLNAASSRSHCIFTIYVESFDPSDNPNDILQSKLALVDLAGSERIDKTGATGVTLQESIGINKSLFVLRQVIQALSEDSSNNSSSSTEDSGRTASTKSKEARERAYIPYRDSKLTSLLKYSLGGNSLTLMIACLSPSDAHFDENLSTLVYASKAQCIANKPMKNEDPKTALIHELRQEVDGLRKQLAQAQEIILHFQPLPRANPSLDTDGDGGQQSECMKCRGAAVQREGDEEGPRRPEPTSSSLAQSKESAASTSTAKAVAGRENAATKKLKLSVIDNVEMIKQLYTTEKTLSDRVRTQSSRIEELVYETRVLNVENQSLRDKVEVLEYLVAELPSQRRRSGDGDNSSDDPEEPEEIPGYGALTSSASSSSRPLVAAPTADRIRDVVRGSRTSKRPSRVAPHDGEASMPPSNQSSHHLQKPDPKAKRRDLETGLLSVRAD